MARRTRDAHMPQPPRFPRTPLAALALLRQVIPEEDARQALAYFEAAKESNEQGDFNAACSYFETS